MDQSGQYSELPPETEQKINLLTVALKRTIEILEIDLHELEVILKEMECDVEDLDLMPSERFKSCPHCCLVMEEKKKKVHRTYLENCLRTCGQ